MARRGLMLMLVTALLLTLPTCTNLGGSDDNGGDGSLHREFFGLFVGISDYMDPNIPDLNVSDIDALEFGARLVQDFPDSWTGGRMVMLTNAAATKSAIRNALDGLLRQAGADDTVLFYYSGHGTYGPGAGSGAEWDGWDEYIVPTNASFDSTANLISDDELTAWLAPFGGRKIVILDSCFSGGFVPGEGGGPALAIKGFQMGGAAAKAVAPPRIRGRFQDIADGSTVVMTASREDQLSFESGYLGHSVFTWYLYEGLEGPADTNDNGDFSAREVFDYASPHTTAVSPQDPVLRGPSLDTLLAW